ncbi:zinc-binding alcohol dehydrogenase family protein [Methylobacillus arboreus]|uniref:zinc-binding alcohol dehydrogenase family protein n=1 Tax=Methylobacillus arboreus TaxID=755170 RepID=UPI001E39FD4B|nr:zinc-binding alcohol dehydrogenase family protein [Methylobacillus arboreus]MCB5190044.1 zinc-binding alcohol dehydrogenase family protein [Methylobacillus arboreus]
MKAVALTRYLPISDPASLLDVDLPTPEPGPRDLLVKIEAVAVNPVDTKVRAPKDKVENTPRVLGWDAVGTVVETGSEASLFKVGDAVYYAGDITRQGSNSEYQVVDERIVGRKPATLSAAEAAALPLTAITAWESLFDRLKVETPPNIKTPKTILIIGGAGGVGSIAIQLAAKVAGLHVIASASRPESAAWCRELGAHNIVDHRGDLITQVQRLGYKFVDYVLILNNTDQHLPAAVELVAPQGAICSIVENANLLDIAPLKNKSARFCWEMMFTRAMYQTGDMIEQHYLLNEVARLVDQGILRTTLTETLSPINAANLRQAHAVLESGNTIGKMVLEGF